MLNMDLSETKELLVDGLVSFTKSQVLIVALLLMLRTKEQMEAMLWYLAEHHMEPLTEDDLLDAAEDISKRIG